MRRGHIAGSANLAAKECDSLGIGAELREQELERYFHPELEIESEPDLTHAAATKEPFDTISITENLNCRR
jgi:hypothetical protein